MLTRSDPEYLRTDQYRDASNLNARIQLHARFSTNPYGWQRWAFDRLHVAPKGRVLELGSGPGRLWVENLDRLPEGWRVTLTDFSLGMLREARHNLASARGRFTFGIADAQAIPFSDGRFDAVIANHMLYHVPDRGKAFSEIHRVLAAGGCLYSATNGTDHMKELLDLIRRFGPDAEAADNAAQGFSLENGADQLAQWFTDVALHRHEDALIVTDAAPLVAYVQSGKRLSNDALRRFREHVEEEIRSRGSIRIRKSTGLFVARSG